MKKITLLFLAVILAFVASTVLAASTSVTGYTKKDGTYVERHKRTQADSSKLNNWSTKGNTNPYTGKKGSGDPYAPKKRKKR